MPTFPMPDSFGRVEVILFFAKEPQTSLPITSVCA